MEKIRKYFGGVEMTWCKVLIFAVATAVLTAGLNVIPALNDTSFQDIAISFECWFLFAIFIIVNCKTWKEASIKCFVFFLISQPLIYLIEVPFVADGWGVFRYYKYWFFLTLATLPGAVVAFQLKKKNWLSVAVLSVPLIFLAYMCPRYFKSALDTFPHHLISAIFCLALAVFFVFVLLDEKKHRAAGLAIIAAVLVATSAFYIARDSGGHSAALTLPEGEWTAVVEDESVASVSIENGNEVTVTSLKSGYTIIDFYCDDGETLHQSLPYQFLADGKNVSLELID